MTVANGNASLRSLGLLLALLTAAGGASRRAQARPLRVVTTNPTYADIAQQVGGPLVSTFSIGKGDEDPHFIRPKPSFAVRLSRADAFVVTGLDLELWVPTLIDKSANPRIRQGQVGYIAVYDGVTLLDIPGGASRAQGGVHLFGNPHIHTSPMNAKIIARNIAAGLCKVDPPHCGQFRRSAERFAQEIDRRMFGPRLLKLFGSGTLTRLTVAGKLIPFLKRHRYRGRPLLDLLGGWARKALPLWGLPLVTYHKNWVYFSRAFGLRVVREVEPKPAIPPSPRSVRALINTMARDGIKVILAANFYDDARVRRICRRVGAVPAIVAIAVRGKPGIGTYFHLVDHWIDSLLAAYRRAGVLR